jgi:hypothetical protein
MPVKTLDGCPVEQRLLIVSKPTKVFGGPAAGLLLLDEG